jgi:hypothetical protein
MKRFKDLLCDYLGCAPETYVREALRRTLYPHAARLGFLMFWFCSPLCLRVVEEAGATENGEALRDVVEDYEYALRLHGGFWLRRLKFRVSGQRLLNLYAEARCHGEKQAIPKPQIGKI